MMLALVALAAGSQAALITGDLINWSANGTSNGVDVAGTYWNRLDLVTNTPRVLLLADKSNEGITLLRTSTAGVNSTLNSVSITNLAALSWIGDSRVASNAYNVTTAGETIAFRVAGLSTGFYYTVSFAAAQSSASYESEAVTVNGLTTTGSSTYNPYANRSGGPNAGAPVDLVWNSIQADSNGYLNFSIIAAGTERPTLSAFQIAVGNVIPEPATVGMLGLGALVTLLIRRMRA
jgi:hypothetical protein